MLTSPAESDPVVIAHRGNSSVAPENTIASIAASEHHAWGVEIDIRYTSDVQYILMHDSTVDRTTNGTGNVSNLSFDYIRSLDASWKFPGYSPEPVPTLLEAVTKSISCDLKLCVEIKAGDEVNSLLSILSPYRNFVELHSFNWPLLQTIAAADTGGDFTYVAIGSGDLDARISDMPTCIDKVSWAFAGVTRTGIDTLHAADKSIYAWTCNSTATTLGLAEWGIDGVITDRPAIMQELFAIPEPGGIALVLGLMFAASVMIYSRS